MVHNAMSHVKYYEESVSLYNSNYSCIDFEEGYSRLWGFGVLGFWGFGGVVQA